jgi:multimeric flavodoxin WrbA
MQTLKIGVKMKILAIMGSPRKGDSCEIIHMIERKMKSLGDVDFEYLFLKDTNLNPCRGCCGCFTKGEEFCPSKDDRESIEAKMRACDGIIFASPVYIVNVTGTMKNFLDRFAYVCHRPRFFGKYALLVANTAVVGLKETLSALEWPAKVWGFHIAGKLGVISFRFLPGRKKKMALKLIDQAAQRFYNTIKNKQAFPTSTFGLAGFKMQKTAFAGMDADNADYKYWKEKGWLDKDALYYYPVKVSKIKKMIADLINKKKFEGKTYLA